MKNYRLLAAMALALAAVSCTRTVVDGTLADAPDSKVIVKQLNINKFVTLDTLKTGRNGHFRYTADVEAGQPEFIYLFYKDTKIASLLLSKGEHATVTADTLGHYTVTGSEESVKLAAVEADYAAFQREVSARVADVEAGLDGAPAELSRAYIKYYRDRVRYVMDNSKSLTVVPVLFQELSPGTAIFSQTTDALHFRAAADSLKKVYPASKYVKALENEAARRANLMDLDLRLKNATEVSFADIVLPDVKGEKVKLSETPGKVVMLYFWSTANAAQKMFNLDSILPIYKDFHPKGLEIYAVSLDTDKPAWADAVRSQQLPWVNVCDTRGVASPYVGVYNVTSIPYVHFIVDGALADDATGITDADAIRRYLAKKL